MSVLIRHRCNMFGAENEGGARALGGLDTTSRITHQWYCETADVLRYFMECEHGHRGQPFFACRKHYHEFRNKVEFCPRCNIPPNDHKCQVVMREVS